MNAITRMAGSHSTELVVGLVNNMPDAAFAASDRQFASLLQAASPGRPVRLRRFAPVARPDGYEPIEALWSTRLDGLVITGAEPKAEVVEEEPTWGLFARLVDWAADHTRSAIWSCLAAQAAVFRLDGVARRRLPQKLSGVFECRGAGAHRLLDDAPAAWPVPHSRFNTLDTRALERAGYGILSHGPAGGADTFIKPVGRSLFVILQGHPEYDADTLLREYRRDVRRWQQGAARPVMPCQYFDAAADALLARCDDPAESLAILASVRPPPAHWLPYSVRLYQNWLASLDAEVDAAAGFSTR